MQEFIDRAVLTSTTVELRGCAFAKNYCATSKCDYSERVVAILYVRSLIVTDSSFTDNTAGALSTEYTVTLRVERSSFYRNTNPYMPTSGSGTQQSNAGGAIFINHAKEVGLADCSFIDNVAQGSGGGVYMQHAAYVTIERSKFARNKAITGAMSMLARGCFVHSLEGGFGIRRMVTITHAMA